VNETFDMSGLNPLTKFDSVAVSCTTAPASALVMIWSQALWISVLMSTVPLFTVNGSHSSAVTSSDWSSEDVRSAVTEYE
jgi:hypothetical protein